MAKQNTSTLLMVRPVQFRYNEQTAVNNFYQNAIEGLSKEEIQKTALEEFDTFANKLQDAGVKVIVVNDTEDPDTPDSIFPNNWVSFHEDGRVGLYPMYAPNRRLERREDILDRMQNEHGLNVTEIVDFTEFEEHDKFLEGTGSLVLDRENKIAYAAISLRTDRIALEHFCETFDYTGVAFTANQTANGERLPIYHTNVMMCVAKQFVVICLDTIDDKEERDMVETTIKESGKEIIEITEDQKHQFAGNMLQVMNEDGKLYLVMSGQAYSSLAEDQIATIEKYCPIIHSSLNMIEGLGGGSARCMMAEVFLPKI